MEINMFDIVQVDFGTTVGSEQSGSRPCVVFQNESGNKYSPTVWVIPLTKKIKKLYLPTHNVIHKTRRNGLSIDSMLLGEGLRSVDKSRIQFKRGTLDNEKDKQAVVEVFLANVTGEKELFDFIRRII